MVSVTVETNICDIPSKLFNKLGQLLDTADQRSSFHWRALVAVLPSNLYKDYEVEKFALKINDGSSAAEALLYDLGSKGYTVGDLIGWLEQNRHDRALELLKDNEPLRILQQPLADIEVTEGMSLMLECEALGFPSPDYQWIREETLLTGQNDRILRIDNIRMEDEGNYICWIRNAVQTCGIFTKWVAVDIIKNTIRENEKWAEADRIDRNIQNRFGQMHIAAAEDTERQPLVITHGCPIIIEQPALASGQVSLDEPIHLTCEASGSGLCYQWIKDNAILRNETSSSLWIRQSRLEHAGTYQCVISNQHREICTEPVRVRICVSSSSMIPEIYKQPVSMTFEGPSKATFFCEARGRGVLVYQWYRDGHFLQGKCSPCLEVPVSSMDDAANYQCEVSNDSGKVLSHVASLKVNFCTSVQLTAQDKVALLIGNQNYRSEALLYAVSLDLQTLSYLLTRLGFKVVTLLDITLEETSNAVDTFCELLGNGVYGLFYFAGHGFEHCGQAYLAPWDVKSGFSTPDCICAEDVLGRMQERQPALSVLLLDICRERNMRADVERPHTFVPSPQGNTVIGYASSFSSKSFEDKEGFFMRNLKKVLCLNKPIQYVFIDLQTELHNDPMKQGYQQYPELKSNLRELRSLTDPIDYTGFTREFFIRQENWRCLAGDLLKEPAPMIFTHSELEIRVEIKCLMIFANVMKVFVTVLDPGKTTLCEAWLINFPNKILAKDPKKISQSPFCKTEIKLQDLQRLQEPLSVDLFIHYRTSQTQSLHEFQHKLPAFKVPLIQNNLCLPLHCALPADLGQSPLQQLQRQPIEQEERDYG